MQAHGWALVSVKASTDLVVDDIIKKLTLSLHKNLRNLKLLQKFDNPKKCNTIMMMMMMNSLDET
jgi:hypothetical protein